MILHDLKTETKACCAFYILFSHEVPANHDANKSSKPTTERSTDLWACALWRTEGTSLPGSQVSALHHSGTAFSWVLPDSQGLLGSAGQLSLSSSVLKNKTVWIIIINLFCKN